MNVTWIILFSIPFVLYLALSLLLRHGLHRSSATDQNSPLSVSVIVAARNEAENILDCLLSLEKLDYPEKLIEIIVVNDRSEDATEQIITQFIRGKNRFKYFKISTPNPNLSGKAGAISQAIGRSQGDIIFITDADCMVPSNWVTKTLHYFSESVGLVAGFTLLKFSSGLFNKIQNLDWAYFLSVAAGAAGRGIPLTCMGNNFAFRRAAYDEVGGYAGVGFSVTEDFALLKAIDQQTRWKIIFPLDLDCLVSSKPVKSLGQFFSQRKRWALGGQSVHLLGKILIGVSLICHYLWLGLVLFSHHYLLLIAGAAIVLIGDFLLLYRSMSRLNSTQLLKYLLLYKFFFVLYSIALLIGFVASRKITWKDVQYQQTNLMAK